MQLTFTFILWICFTILLVDKKVFFASQCIIYIYIYKNIYKCINALFVTYKIHEIPIFLVLLMFCTFLIICLWFRLTAITSSLAHSSFSQGASQYSNWCFLGSSLLHPPACDPETDRIQPSWRTSQSCNCTARNEELWARMHRCLLCGSLS